MLYSLSVSNYILIGSLETSFPEGLVIISGETGAGKSILLGALSLVLGAKADASLVGPAGDHCVVEAVFGMDDRVRRILEEADLPADDNRLVLRRTLSRNGRSRSFAGDEPVSLAVLQALSASLVDIHSQHQSLRLSDERFRREALDLWAGCTQQDLECSQVWKELQEGRRQLDELRQQMARARQEQEYHQARWEKLEAARLQEGELEALEQEQKQLSHAEELKETLYAAQNLLRPESDGAPDPVRALREAGRLLGRAGRFIPSLEPLEQRLESARLELEDIAAEVESVNGGLEVSDKRLEQVQERLSLLWGLLQQFGAATVEELMVLRDQLAGQAGMADHLAEQEKALCARLEALEARHRELCSGLHERRSKAAGPFAQAVRLLLSRLELDGDIFDVRLDPVPQGAHGQDQVQFLSHNASGGELSRIMLALKAVMARFQHMPTLIFDEIDTGVSGSAADKMGSLVCEMGADMQVFAITHLPQVAAKGSAHYLVSKAGGQSTLRALDRAGRVQELARMLSGSAITPAAVANAEALLGA